MYRVDQVRLVGEEPARCSLVAASMAWRRRLSHQYAIDATAAEGLAQDAASERQVEAVDRLARKRRGPWVQKSASPPCPSPSGASARGSTSTKPWEIRVDGGSRRITRRPVCARASYERR